MTIIAQSGDVVGRGVQISAGMGKDGEAPTASDDPNDGNVLISAAGNVDLESVQATSDSKSSSKAGGVSIGVAAGIDAGGNILGGGPTASASYSSGKENGSSVTQVNSNVSGTNTVTVVAGDTLTLAGGVLSGNTVNASAANGIVIESRQDTASYDEKTQSAQLGISSGGISGGYNQGRSPATIPTSRNRAASSPAPVAITSTPTVPSISSADSSARPPIPRITI
ncbi:hypothetical protein FHT86_005575 [Rhizobium sp. BK313]|nr:hypothetical protein [Rhizobium sp. BK313]